MIRHELRRAADVLRAVGSSMAQLGKLSSSVAKRIVSHGTSRAFVMLHPHADVLKIKRRFIGSGADRAMLQSLHSPVVQDPQHLPMLNIVLGSIDADGVEALVTDPTVRYVGDPLAMTVIQPVESRLTALPTDTTWGIDRLGIPTLWATGLTGRGIRVAHLDTGVDPSHPALTGAVLGYLLTDLNGHPVEGAQPFDPDGHGTHTAGIVAGRPVDGRSIGVAPGVGIYSATVIEGGSVGNRILYGLEWAARNAVHIINISLGIPGYKHDFYEVITALREMGILVVAAVGNDGPGASRSPGNYDNVISVGASSINGQICQFSSSDNHPSARLRVPSLVAPGEEVISAWTHGEYRSQSGTSMAAPHITGLAALLLEACPCTSIDDLLRAILGSCELGQMSRDRANHGMPDAPRALKLLTGADA